MTGRHEGPPLGSEAREATAAPWHGKHRTLSEVVDDALASSEVRAHIEWIKTHPPGARYPEPEPDEPPRCWSCGHTTDMFCECQCCNDTHDGGPDDV